jgi:hypothetical protein
MKVIVGDLAQIGLRNLGEDGRRKAWGWIDSLKRWDTDPFVREHSVMLGDDNTYMFRTTSDLRVFFSLEEDTITVLDLARKDTIVRSGRVNRAG